MNTNIHQSHLSTTDSLHETGIDFIQHKPLDALIDVEEDSKVKYNSILKLIESTSDMSTQEKIDAMNKSYNRRSQEHWQNIRNFAFVSLGLLGLVIIAPSTTKTIHKIISA
ncbi:hypothetical protein [Coprococcus catus]|uniref:hypothetical protein n=1 Tax=Coprococcus catus TaxID=116085 RepID=UPI001C8CEEE4|nr:hypothetical protein [Coprococcus catus]MBX9231661.1 hypothetical protein [Coprococcus catus]MCT6801525.1 hypothetical protein [Coprococcus catus]